MYELWVGEEDFPLAGVREYRQFWNEIADRGGCPNLIRFTPDKSAAYLTRKEDSPSSDWTNFSMPVMEQEAQLLFDDPKSSELVKFIANVYLDAIKYAKEHKMILRIE